MPGAGSPQARRVQYTPEELQVEPSCEITHKTIENQRTRRQGAGGRRRRGDSTAGEGGFTCVFLVPGIKYHMMLR